MRTKIAIALLEDLLITPNRISYLIKPEERSNSDAATIITEIYLGFPTIIIREFDSQKGYFAGNIGLHIEGDEEPSIPEEWYENLECKTIEKSIIALNIIKQENISE